MRINNLSVIYYSIYNLNSIVKFLELHNIDYKIKEDDNENEDNKNIHIVINNKIIKSSNWIIFNHKTKTIRIVKRKDFSLIEYDYDITKVTELLVFSKEHTIKDIYSTSKNRDLVKFRSAIYYGLVSLGFSVSEISSKFDFDKTTVNYNINKLYENPEMFDEIDKFIIQ